MSNSLVADDAIDGGDTGDVFLRTNVVMQQSEHKYEKYFALFFITPSCTKNQISQNKRNPLNINIANETYFCRISQANICGFSALYWRTMDTTSGVVTLGLLPPIWPGFMLPVLRYLITQECITKHHDSFSDMLNTKNKDLFHYHVNTIKYLAPVPWIKLT